MLLLLLLVAYVSAEKKYVPVEHFDGKIRYHEADEFGLPMIYPSPAAGRTWKLNGCDRILDPQMKITPEGDGSYLINSNEIRMSVTTPSDMVQWRDVEMTGCFRRAKKLEPLRSDPGADDLTPHLALYARGSIHTACSGNDHCCYGTAYKGGIWPLGGADSGRTRWVKECDHPNYSGSKEGKKHDIDFDKWFGFKVTIRNNSNNSVSMESWGSHNCDNTSWTALAETTDTGSWKCEHPIPSSCKPFNGGPHRTDTTVLSWAGPEVCYRSDNMPYYFKSLTVRELGPGNYPKGCTGFLCKAIKCST
jgi:hypothetical protein